MTVPVIDVSPVRLRPGADRGKVAKAIDSACRSCGFFYVTGHGVDPALEKKLEDLSRKFFAKDDAWKKKIEMAKGGKAWRWGSPRSGES